MYGQNHSCEEGSKSVLIPENGPEEAVKKQDLGYVGDNNNNNESNSKIGNSSEGLSKPKRQMKTPFQLETLEKAYAGLLSLTFFYFIFFLFPIY